MSKNGKGNDTFASVLAYAETEQGNINNRKESVAGRLMTLACSFKDLEPFLEGCEAAQEDRRESLKKKYKDDAKGYKAHKNLPACWTQAKSDIRKIWERGVHPSEFGSYSELQRKLQEIRKASRPAKAKAVTTEGSNVVDVMNNTVTDTLFSEVLGRIEQLPTETQAEIAARLSDIVEEYESKVTNADVAALEDAQIQQVAVNE